MARKPPHYRYSPDPDYRCDVCLYWEPFASGEGGFCVLYSVVVDGSYVCDRFEAAPVQRTINPEEGRYWIAEATADDRFNLRRWLRSAATRRPWGMPVWVAPEKTGPIDPRLIDQLIRLFEAMKEGRGRLTRTQLRRYRQLILARTLRTLAKR